MTDSVEDLRARLDALQPSQVEETVAVAEAILRPAVGDLLATRSLALALIKLDQLDRADEVIQEALLAHPGDETVLRRADDVVRRRRWIAANTPAAKQRGPKRRSATGAPRTWIKAVHDDGSGWLEQPGAELWLSDPGQRDADGNRRYTAAGDPFGRPSWRAGEQVGVYLGTTKRVPLLVQITKDPEFDPSFVQAADRAGEGDGERWPWVTWVRVLKAVEVGDAPTLEDLEIPTSSLQQRARLLTDPATHARLVEALSIAG